MAGGIGFQDAGHLRSPKRSLLPLTTSFHLIILVIALSIVTLSFLMTTNDQHAVFFPGVPLALPECCLTKMYFGIDCPGCGMTRAFIRISHGQFFKAVELNLASPVVYLFVVIQIPWHAMQLVRIAKGCNPVDSLWTIAPISIATATLIVAWLWR